MNSRSIKVRHQRHRGYALLLSLILLMLVSLAALAVSRAALARSLAAREAQQDLQRRWGMLSCQSTLLPHAEKILGQTEATLHTSERLWQSSITLGGERFDLVIADESAKASAPSLLQRHGLAPAEQSIRLLCLTSPLAARVRIRGGEMQPYIMPATYGSIFDQATPIALCGLDGSSASAPAALITCWGDGRLNINRATQSVLNEVCGGVLDGSQVQEIIANQQAGRVMSVAGVLNAMQLSPPIHAAASQLLTDHSVAHSLWIRCSDSRRSWWSLAVEDQSQPPGSQLKYFQW